MNTLSENSPSLRGSARFKSTAIRQRVRITARRFFLAGTLGHKR